MDLSKYFRPLLVVVTIVVFLIIFAFAWSGIVASVEHNDEFGYFRHRRTAVYVSAEPGCGIGKMSLGGQPARSSEGEYYRMYLHPGKHWLIVEAGRHALKREIAVGSDDIYLVVRCSARGLTVDKS